METHYHISVLAGTLSTLQTSCCFRGSTVNQIVPSSKEEAREGESPGMASQKEEVRGGGGGGGASKLCMVNLYAW